MGGVVVPAQGCHPSQPPGSPMRRERASRSCIWGPAGARHMCSACPAAGTTRSSGPVPPLVGGPGLSVSPPWASGWNCSLKPLLVGSQIHVLEGGA